MTTRNKVPRLSRSNEKILHYLFVWSKEWSNNTREVSLSATYAAPASLARPRLNTTRTSLGSGGGYLQNVSLFTLNKYVILVDVCPIHVLLLTIDTASTARDATSIIDRTCVYTVCLATIMLQQQKISYHGVHPSSTST